MRMLYARIHFHLLDNLATESVVRQHALNRVLEHSLRMLADEVLKLREHCAARIAGVMEIFFQLRPFSGQLYVRSVHHDNEVAHIGVRREHWLMLAAKQTCNLRRNPTERLPVCINEMPLLRRVRRLEKLCSLIHWNCS